MTNELTYNNFSEHSKKNWPPVTQQCHPDIFMLYPRDIETCQILFEILENKTTFKFTTDKINNFYLDGLDYFEINIRDTRKH